MIVKVCGMRNAENIRQLEKTDADFLGFIFYPKSPRFVSEPNEAILNCSLKKVGVFVNATLKNILSSVETYKLDYVQLHGNESPMVCANLKNLGLTVLKAFPIENENDLQNTKEYEDVVDYFLFDTKCADYGGSGKRFDWSVLNQYQGETPFLLSGGIKPESLNDLIAFEHPRFEGIDLNSGFEISPAMKDADLLKDFITKFRNQKNN